MDDPLRNPAAWPCPHADAYRRLLTLLRNGGHDRPAIAAAYRGTCECLDCDFHPDPRCSRCDASLVFSDDSCVDGHRHLSIVVHGNDFLRCSALWNMVLHGVFSEGLMREAVVASTDFNKDITSDWTLLPGMAATMMGIPERAGRPVDPDAALRFAAEHFKPFTLDMCAFAFTAISYITDCAETSFEEVCIGLADCPVARGAMLRAYRAEIDNLQQCDCEVCQWGDEVHPEGTEIVLSSNTQHCIRHFEAMCLRIGGAP
jgi:hypothetical protein